MATKQDHARQSDKAKAVIAKLNQMSESGQTATLVWMLDEWKLDLLLLALGDGEVAIREP